MLRPGLIHDKTDMKLLILYIAEKFPEYADRDYIWELSMCDEGVNYFLFSDALAELVELQLMDRIDEDYFAITRKGRDTVEVLQTDLAYSVRMKVDRNVPDFLRRAERDSLIRTRCVPQEDGSCTLELTLNDDAGPVMKLELYAAGADTAQALARNFRRRADAVYKAVTDTLK